MVKARRKGEKIKSWKMGVVWWKGWDAKFNIGTFVLISCSLSFCWNWKLAKVVLILQTQDH